MMQLPKYMVGIAYNIKAFNKHVQELQMELTKYNEHGDDLLTTSLLVAYEHVPDAEFQHVLHRKRDEHDTNTAMPSYCPEPSASTTRSPEGIQFVGWSRRRRNNPMCPQLWLWDSKPYFWCKYHGHWSLNEGHTSDLCTGRGFQGAKKTQLDEDHHEKETLGIRLASSAFPLMKIRRKTTRDDE